VTIEIEHPCPTDVADRFGPIARIYDVVDVAFFLVGKDPRGAVARAIPASAERILDLGTGTGSVLAALARTHPNAQVVGLDASAGMLAAAARKLGRLEHRGGPLAAARLVCASAAELPFHDESFDAVTGSLFFHELPPLVRRRAFEEALRVLAPGGAMVILDLDRRPEGWLAPVQRMIEAFEEDWAWELSGGGLERELSTRGLDDVLVTREIPFVQLAVAGKPKLAA
jgi:ubiquinone/menaquinone biosynthesis C-methylase UbiE